MQQDTEPTAQGYSNLVHNLTEVRVTILEQVAESLALTATECEWNQDSQNDRAQCRQYASIFILSANDQHKSFERP